MNNPNTEPTDNARKDPDEWLSAMTQWLALRRRISRPVRAGGHARGLQRQSDEGRGVKTHRRDAPAGGGGMKIIGRHPEGDVLQSLSSPS